LRRRKKKTFEARKRLLKSREASSKLTSGSSDKISRGSRARRGGPITNAEIEVNSSTLSRRSGSRKETIENDRIVAQSIREDAALKIFNRGAGTLLSFDDKLLILRLITNLRLRDKTTSRTAIHSTVATCLQMSHNTVDRVWKEYLTLKDQDNDSNIFDLTIQEKSDRGTASADYQYTHEKLKKEILIGLHEIVLNNLKIKKLMSYPDLARECFEQYNLKISSNGLRQAMIREFDYVYKSFQHETKSSLKTQWQIRQFLVKYAGKFFIQ
jgi:hypothetical protein